MSDLVRRLRDKVEASRIYDDDEELLDEAADRIQKLEAELVRTFNHMMNDAKRIEKLEAALRKISQQNTLWGAICKAKHALGDFDRKALEENNDPTT